MPFFDGAGISTARWQIGHRPDTFVSHGSKHVFCRETAPQHRFALQHQRSMKKNRTTHVEDMAARQQPQRLRALALVRCDKLTAEATLDVLNRMSGTYLQNMPGVVPAISALYVRDCGELDWRSLQWLPTVGIMLKVWEGGREVDMRYARARKKARFVR